MLYLKLLKEIVDLIKKLLHHLSAIVGALE